MFYPKVNTESLLKVMVDPKFNMCLLPPFTLPLFILRKRIRGY